MIVFNWLKCERVFALMVIVLMACGGGQGPNDDATSNLSFQVMWERPAGFRPASLADCADVATVQAAVYSVSGELLGQGGPWSCATGSGIISGLPANYYATIGVAGYGPDGALLYYGQNADPVFLSPGAVDGGIITASAFVPNLLGPADSAIVPTDALSLRWDRLLGATGYQVTLATDSSFSGSSVIQQITFDDGDVTSVTPDVTGLQQNYTYYWRVQAVSDAGSLSTPSAARRFSLGVIEITSVSFVGDDPAGVAAPVQTTVTFTYATLDYSQVQNGDTITQWSAPMDSSDYFALQEIITSYKLIGQSDITYTPIPCSGWSGLDVSMVYNATTYGFSISSMVCNSAEWPSAVSSLVALKDELVAKYQP